MELASIILSLFLSIRFIHKLTGLVWLWWRKEYRLDRMLIHLRTFQGKSLIFSKSDLALSGLLVLSFIPGFDDGSRFGIGFLAIIFAIQYGKRIRHWLIPPFSPKVIAMYAVFSLFVLGVYFFGIPLYAAFMIVDVCMFALSWPIVFLLGVPTELYHAAIISRAVGKIRQHTPMTVIAITGSYGKTSIKDYLAKILGSSFKTLKTEASKNSPIGIAEVVNAELQPDHEVFVVEMGAYKPGEISYMSGMIRPEIAILTAINAQHQDLFGSIEVTMKAKYELVQGLTGRKLVIANRDDSNVVTMGEWAKRDGYNVIWFSKKNNAKNIFSDVSGTRFDCIFEKESIHVEAHVVGEYQVSNILAAIVAARACGLTLSDAAKAASNIQPAVGVMEVKKGINGSVFIDDTFNNNPDAAKAAIAFLAKHKGKKILVFQPMIELGSFAEKSHEDVGFEAGKSADTIFLTNANWFTFFERGVRKTSKTVPLMVASPTKAADYIEKHVMKGDMVLFKGKDAKHVLTRFISGI